VTRSVKPEERALTVRGRVTKQRIVAAAADLIYAKGAERVSLEEVMEASATSKSQLYHYFADKDALVRAVIAFQTGRILDANTDFIKSLNSFEGLRIWGDAVVAAYRQSGAGGCPLGSLASELAAQSEQARRILDESFLSWSAVIESGLSHMKTLGLINPAADAKAIALAVLAAIQGGILLSKTARSTQPLERALDMAIAHVERYAA
jgi:AcrR family transcriptional regulator